MKKFAILLALILLGNVAFASNYESKQYYKIYN